MHRGEAKEVWAPLVDYLEGDDHLDDRGNAHLAEVDKVSARARRHLGRRMPLPCRCGRQLLRPRLGQDEDEVLYDVARWVSLEEMAQLTGSALPTSATSPAERVAARLTRRRGNRPQPRHTTRRARRA